MDTRYPTDEELLKIATWDYNDIPAMMEFVHSLWEFKEFGWQQDGDIYILATGGWSGNESLIGALQDNYMFWSLYWAESTRGGRHTFYRLTLENMEKMKPRDR